MSCDSHQMSDTTECWSETFADSTDTAILNGQISTRADSLIYTHRFADLATQFVSDALPLVDVDADALAEDEFHCCRMTQLHYHLHYQIHPLIVWSHSVEMNRVMD